MTTRDLVALWEEHCRCEFETRDANATMATMVSQPYVNHISTMTGGLGYGPLRRFYAYHLIPVNPPDFRLTPVSRTVGTDTVVDEFIVHFTHTTMMDWLLPGVPPTGRAVEIPTVAIVKFEGDKVAHEHIYWDQASLLVQVGVLNPHGLPVVGAETARKVVDRRLPSNRLMERWQESEGKPITDLPSHSC
jgi:carboxymethylenebutenolidase